MFECVLFKFVCEYVRLHSCRYSQFQDEYSLDQVINSRKVFDFLTLLQCW